MKRSIFILACILVCKFTWSQNVPWGAYVSSSKPHGQNALRYQLVDNVLYSATSRFSVTSNPYSPDLAYLFNGNYDQIAVTVSGQPTTFTIDFTGKGSPTITYANGFVYLHFYSVNLPASVSGRAQAQNGTWSNIINWTNVASNPSTYAVWQGQVGLGNFMNKLEITITPNGSNPASLSQIEYVMDRVGQYEQGVVTKFDNQTLHKTLSWKDDNNALNASISNTGFAAFKRVNVTTGELYLTHDNRSGFSNACQTLHTYNACGALGFLSFGFGTSTGVTGSPTGTPDPLTIRQENMAVGINNNFPLAKLHIVGAGISSATSAFLIQNSATNDLIKVSDDATFKIGTTALKAKFDVNGEITTRKVKVTQLGWPDYVFHRNYELPTLEYVEKYIKKHQHLPDVPSADEVSRDGLDLGDNQALLLQKIEELTLYMIEQNKKMELMQEKIRQLETRISKKK